MRVGWSEEAGPRVRGGAWWATVLGVAKSQDRTERLPFHS